MNQIVIGVSAAFALATLSACGHSSSDSSNAGSNPKTISSMSAEERALHCFLDVNPERNTTTRQGFVSALQGTWDHFPTGGSQDLDKRTFDFDTNRNVATVTDYFQDGKNIQDIAWGKVCISEPLGSDQGGYAGFRIIEMMAKDNSGAAAIAVKINAAGTDLSLSDYYYQRFTNDSLAALSTALSQMPTIWEYSAKEQ